MSPYTRELSLSELYLLAYHELRPPFVIQWVLEAPDLPPAEALYEALQRCSEANPGTCLRLHEDVCPARWTLGPEPTLTLVDAPEFDGFSGHGAEFSRWSLDASTGPTAEVVAVRARDRSFLVFRAVHAVMDGQGVLHWARDFFRCLRREEPVGHGSTLDVDALLDRLGRPEKEPTQQDAVHPLGKPDLSRSGDFQWRRLSLPGVRDSNLIGRVAVTLRDVSRPQLAPGRHVRIHIPHDLRHATQEERSTANLFVSLHVDVLPEDTADAVGMKLVQSIYRKDNLRPYEFQTARRRGSLAMYRTKTYRDLVTAHDTGLYAASATVSHLGRLDGSDFRGPDFEPVTGFFIPLFGDTRCVLNMNGFDDRLELAVGVSDRFSGAHHEALDGLVARLHDALVTR